MFEFKPGLSGSTVKNEAQKLYEGALGIFNDLTGQTAEDQRTEATNKANLQAVESTNETNKEIAMENLGFQRELQEYNKSLQERMFERQDTSYQRTAADMLAAGLNPLSMQGTNGAGEAIAQTPLNNQYQAQAPQFQKANVMSSKMQVVDQAFSHAMGMLSQIEALKKGKAERDALQLENDRKYFDNLVYEQSHGIGHHPGKKPHYRPQGDIELTKDFNNYVQGQYYENENKIREYEHKVQSNKYDSDSKYEQMLTALEDWAINGRGEQALEKLFDKYPSLRGIADATLPGKLADKVKGTQTYNYYKHKYEQAQKIVNGYNKAKQGYNDFMNKVANRKKNKK